MTNWLWISGASGYYCALVIWIIAQRTHHFHGKYSHSWMIGVLLMVFGSMQIAGSLSNSLILLVELISLGMPIIVTSIDVDDHRRERRGLSGHKPDCWMGKTEGHRNNFEPAEHVISVTKDESWSSR